MNQLAVTNESKSSRRRQFGIRHLFGLMAVVGSLIVGIPAVVSAETWIVFIAGLLFITVFCMVEVLGRKRAMVPRSVTILLGGGMFIFAVTFTFQCLRYGPPTTPHVLWIVFALVSVCSAVACLLRRESREGTVVRRIAFPLVFMLAVTLAWRWYTTSGERHFVNRFGQRGMRGRVSYDLRSTIRVGDRRSERSGIASQLRLLADVAALENVQIEDVALASDWEALATSPSLWSVALSGLQVDAARARSLSNLTSLHQLSFFDCHLPLEIMDTLPASSRLCVLQIRNCEGGTLEGLSRIKEIRTLNLQGTQLDSHDLQAIAQLLKLTNVNLTETQITDEMLRAFARSLKANSPLRIGKFELVMRSENCTVRGIADLLASGAIDQLTVDLEPDAIDQLSRKFPMVTIESDSQSNAHGGTR